MNQGVDSELHCMPESNENSCKISVPEPYSLFTLCQKINVPEHKSFLGLLLILHLTTSNSQAI